MEEDPPLLKAVKAANPRLSAENAEIVARAIEAKMGMEVEPDMLATLSEEETTSLI